MPNAIFRADASPEGGGGHIMRCMALVEALSDLGWLCRFAVRPPTLETMSALRTSGYEVMDLMNDEDSEPPELAARWPDGVDWLVVDHYGRDARFESACRPWAKRIMVIDDLADRPHDCDLLLDQTLGRTAAAYAGHVPDGCRLLLGPGYALLRPEFARARPAALARRQENGPVRRILVSMGATDPHNVTVVALEGIRRAGLKVEVDVVAGAASPHIAALRALAEDIPFPVTIHESVDAMADLMARADIAIGAAGSTSWERCCLGLATLLVVTSENQRDIARSLTELGATGMLGSIDTLDADRIGTTLAEFSAGDEERLDMNVRAAGVCDGLGARRVALGLSPERSRDGKAITLRPATADDAALMFDWQQHPATRRYAWNPGLPSYEEHQGWLVGKLADPDCIFSMILCCDETVGVIRLDREGAASEARESYEVSIYTAPDRYQMGYALAGLKLARRLMPEAIILAKIMEDNAASNALFRRAGYVFQDGWHVSLPRRCFATQTIERQLS